MRSLVVVATTRGGAVNRFEKRSLIEARNLKDFLDLTGEYETISLYELDRSVGPMRQWSELDETGR